MKNRTRNAIPISFPFSSGRTFPTAYTHVIYYNKLKCCKIVHLLNLSWYSKCAKPYAPYLFCSIGIIHTFAAPVELGIIFWPAPRPPRQSFIDGPSTVFWVAGKSKNKVHQQSKDINGFHYIKMMRMIIGLKYSRLIQTIEQLSRKNSPTN